MGKELDGLSFKDLQQMEDKLTEGIMSIKSKKVHWFLFISLINSNLSILEVNKRRTDNKNTY